MPLLDLLVTLVVLALIFAVIWWAITQIPIPDPFSWVVRVLFALVVVVVLVSVLLGGGGGLHLGSVH